MAPARFATLALLLGGCGNVTPKPSAEPVVTVQIAEVDAGPPPLAVVDSTDAAIPDDTAPPCLPEYGTREGYRLDGGSTSKAAHRSSWQVSSYERWRDAVEDYDGVHGVYQDALGPAAAPFAAYLSVMHDRIHPFFADSFLGSLDALPKSHPLSNFEMSTHLEIVLSKEGRVLRMGVVKTSGTTAFDIAALDAVERASPFGVAPSPIVSKDGRVYVQWEFHRNPDCACSTRNAHPFLLGSGATALPL